MGGAAASGHFGHVVSGGVEEYKKKGSAIEGGTDACGRRPRVRKRDNGRIFYLKKKGRGPLSSKEGISIRGSAVCRRTLHRQLLRNRKK